MVIWRVAWLRVANGGRPSALMFSGSPSGSETDRSITTVWPAMTETSSIGSMVGGWLGGPLTATDVSSVAVSAPSLVVSRSVWSPGALKVAVVAGEDGLAKVTVPGPDSLLEDVVSVLPAGKPSSVAEPLSVAAEGMVTLRS